MKKSKYFINWCKKPEIEFSAEIGLEKAIFWSPDIANSPSQSPREISAKNRLPSKNIVISDSIFPTMKKRLNVLSLRGLILKGLMYIV